MSNTRPKGKATPLSPDEVKREFVQNIDPIIIQAVNNLLIKNHSNYSIVLKQETIMQEALTLKGLTETRERNRQEKEWYDAHQFDFEDVFRKAGWSVEYDKPGFNETYPATFTFKQKRRR